MPRRKRAALLGGALYVVALTVIAMWPTHIDSGIDVVNNTIVGRWLLAQNLSHSEAYDLIQFWANVVLYLPLGALAMLLAARTRWWHAVAFALAVSTAFELMQATLRPGRTADLSDVIANTLGAAVGAGIAVGVHAALSDRPGAHRA